MSTENLDWIKVADVGDLPEGRVKTVTARTTSICLVHFDGQWTTTAHTSAAPWAKVRLKKASRMPAGSAARGMAGTLIP